MSFQSWGGSWCTYADAMDLCTNNAINYSIEKRQEARGEEKTAPLTNPSPAEITRILNKRYTRAKINVICRIHGIKCAQSVTKATLITFLIVKFGAAVIDNVVLHTPPAVAMDTTD